MDNRHRILLITTGGTIAGRVNVDAHDEQLLRSAAEFPNLLGNITSYLSSKLRVNVEITIEALCDVDSSDILPSHWMSLANKIKDNYDNYDSFIITHGTNTLGYTCAALSFSLVNPNKPIILTGSQVAAGLPGSDALVNLENAIRVALWTFDDEKKMRGVLAVFGSHIISGTRVKKETEFDYDCFKSFGTGSVGRIGRIININKANLDKHNGYLEQKGRYGRAKFARDLRCEIDFDTRIMSITEFPGMSSDIFKTLADHNEVQGFILRAFGAGDPCSLHRQAFEYLKGKEIPLVITTQAPQGNSNLEVNKPGKLLKEQKLAIPAFDMSIESQTTKLAWLLAKKKKRELTYTQLVEQMVYDFRGEIDPIET